MKVRNVAAHLPDGERLVLPALGNKVIRRGEPFDAPADVAASLLDQRDAYQPVDKEAKDLLKAMDAAAEAELAAKAKDLSSSLTEPEKDAIWNDIAADAAEGAE